MSTARISFTQINTRILDRLFQNFNKLEGIQEQLATGKRVNKPSDDPIAVTNAMEMRSEVNRLNTYQRNIDDGLAYLGTVETTLSTSNNLYQNMRERAIQASNDSYTADSRKFIGQEVKGMLEQMVALSNTAFKGEFVFSGNNTQVPPYEMRTGQAAIFDVPAANGNLQLLPADLGNPLRIRDKNVTDAKISNDYAEAYLLIPGTVKIPNLTEGTDYNINYVKGEVTFLTTAASDLAATAGGIDMQFAWIRRNEKDLDGVVNREVEESVSARINTTASEVFGAPLEITAWEAVINLLEGTYLNRADKIRSSIDKLDMSMNRQLAAQSTNGARVLRLESTESRNDERTIYTSKLQSEAEDVDFAEAVSNFTMQQAVYEASLKMGARAIQNTLVNFL